MRHQRHVDGQQAAHDSVPARGKGVGGDPTVTESSESDGTTLCESQSTSWAPHGKKEAVCVRATGKGREQRLGVVA